MRELFCLNVVCYKVSFVALILVYCFARYDQRIKVRWLT